MKNDIFVKLNFKTIGEIKSLIVDKGNAKAINDRYIMCAGKHNKDGWTIIFKTNSYSEAESIIQGAQKKNYNIKPLIHNVQDEDKLELFPMRRDYRQVV